MRIQYNFFGTNHLIKEAEIHGGDMFQGRAHFKGISIDKRVQLFRDVGSFIVDNNIPLRFVCVDVDAHRSKYKFPEPEYRLGLMLFLERLCDYLENIDDLGIVFGDYEKDEIASSILDFSQFKHEGRTPMYFGRHLGRLLDTIYFTKSHHSRFLQIADVVLYLANRYARSTSEPVKWHDKEVFKVWEELRDNNDLVIQDWPH